MISSGPAAQPSRTPGKKILENVPACSTMSGATDHRLAGGAELKQFQWVAGKPKTPANIQHWLYQHAWIVTGAKFGWWHGADALETLIRVDQHVEREWGIGAKSEAVARAALSQVRRRSQ